METRIFLNVFWFYRKQRLKNGRNAKKERREKATEAERDGSTSFSSGSGTHEAGHQDHYRAATILGHDTTR